MPFESVREKKSNITGSAENGKNRGVSIYLAVMAMSVLFSIAFGMSVISISRIKSLTNVGNSVVAFYAAESGIERGLKEVGSATDPGFGDYLDLNGNGFMDEDDAVFQVEVIGPAVGNCGAAAEFCIKSVGKYKGTQRSIQVQR